MNQWRKGIASWKVGKTLYLSIPFTWLLDDAEIIAKQHKGKVIAGGPAVRLMGTPWAETPDRVPFDTLSFHNPLATYTSRGCPNKCSFCAVPKIEGDLVELDTWKPAPVVCDNNITACSERHFEKVIDSLLPFPMVDFNQGLDAALFTDFHAWHLSRLQSVKVRFAYDKKHKQTTVKQAIDLCRIHRITDIGIYCLIGYDDSPEIAKSRLDEIRLWKVLPFAMRYQPLDTTIKNSFVADTWTEGKLRKFTQYYNHLNFKGFMPFEDFHRYPVGGHEQQQELFKYVQK
jgi:hypothetical protein